MKKKKQNSFKTSIGGQALIEGILMRGPKTQAIAVRTPQGIHLKTESLKFIKDRYKIAGWPFVRGVINFGSSMVSGVRALMFAANFAVAAVSGTESNQDNETNEDNENNDNNAGVPEKSTISPDTGNKKAVPPAGEPAKSDGFTVIIASILGIAMSVGLFMLLPTFLAGFMTKFTNRGIFKNLIEGALRIIIFILYIALSSLLKDMKRVWQYHGAEHKTIFCYEKKIPLTIENCKAQPRCHPRCGTSFMFLVIFISIVFFSVFSWKSIWLRLLIRLAFLPVIVSISYEIIKLTGRFDNIITRIVSAPGKALQRLTTREPEEDMLEVAIKALVAVIPETEGEDKW